MTFLNSSLESSPDLKKKRKAILTFYKFYSII